MVQTLSVSVCIPTYNRPELLTQAIESVLSQTTPPCEIVVGDDSRDARSEKAVAMIQETSRVPIRYRRNSPGLGQDGNTNMLFELARGETLVLLHDDDLLLPNAIEDLSNCFQEHPQLTAAYGKQYVVSVDGEIDYEASDRLNRHYFRSEASAGLQRSAAVAGIVQQFPNDCYLIRSAAARAVKWRTREEVGDGCDYDFGLRLAASHDGFFFLNKFTSKYRLTAHSISKSSNNDAAMQAFLVLKETRVPEDASWAKEFQLKILAPGAVSQLLHRGRNQEALGILFSRHYAFEKRFHPRGLYHLMRALTGNIASAGGKS